MESIFFYIAHYSHFYLFVSLNFIKNSTIATLKTKEQMRLLFLLVFIISSSFAIAIDKTWYENTNEKS